MMNLKQKRREAALSKELLAVEKQEKKIAQATLKAKPAAWKTELENRISGSQKTRKTKGFCQDNLPSVKT